MMPSGGERRIEGRGILLLLPLILFLSVMLVVPLASLVRTAVQGGSAALDSTTIQAMRNSVLLSMSVALGSILLCIVPAYVNSRRTLVSGFIQRSLVLLPLTFSGVVVGYLTIMMLGRLGAIPQWSERLTGTSILAGSAYTMIGIAVAYLYFEIPRAMLALESAFRTVDPELERAAATLGASRLRTFATVVLPMTWRRIVATFLLTFSVSLGSYGVVLMLSRRTTFLPLEVYVAFTGLVDDARAAMLSVLLLSISTAVAVLHSFLRKESHA